MSLIADRFRVKAASGGDASTTQLHMAPLRCGGWNEELPRRSATLARASLAVAVPLTEFVVMVFAALVAEALYHVVAYGWNGLNSPNMELCSLVVLLFVLTNALRGDYRVADYLALRAHPWRLLTVWSASFLIALTFGFLTKTTGESSRASIVVFYVVGYITVYATRLALLHVARNAAMAGGVVSRRVFLVGFEENIETFTRRYQPWNSGVNVVAAIGLRDDTETLEEDLALAIATVRMLRPDDVFILVPWSQTDVIDSCITAFLCVPVQIHLGPERVLDRFVDARIDKIGTIPSLSLGGHPLNPAEVIVKRLFDVVVSFKALLFLSLLLPLIVTLHGTFATRV